jgi:hypothetical protein
MCFIGYIFIQLGWSFILWNNSMSLCTFFAVEIWRVSYFFIRVNKRWIFYGVDQRLWLPYGRLA